MADVKDSVMAVEDWNDGLCGNVNEGWDESRVVHRTPADNIKLFTLPIVD